MLVHNARPLVDPGSTPHHQHRSAPIRIAGSAYVPSFAPSHRDRWVVPGRGQLSGNLTASDSPVLRCQLELERKPEEAHVIDVNEGYC